MDTYTIKQNGQVELERATWFIVLTTLMSHYGFSKKRAEDVLFKAKNMKTGMAVAHPASGAKPLLIMHSLEDENA